MYFKQIDEIVNGTKTQTRRICKPGESYRYLDTYGTQRMWTHEDRHEALHARANETILDVYGPSNRLKWEVGRDYAVSPGRGKPGVWWNAESKQWTQYPNENDCAPCGGFGEDDGLDCPDCSGTGSQGWQPLRIRLLEIRREPLRDISEEDAAAEGVRGYDVYTSHDNHGEVDYVATPADAYRDLWNSINTRPGTRWDDNPHVWALTFEVVRA